MKRWIVLGLCIGVGLGWCIGASQPAGARSKGKAKQIPLPVQLPIPQMRGTPPQTLRKNPHIQPPLEKERPPFYVPAGVTNLALHKKVTSSDPHPITGSLEMIVDGNKEAVPEALVQLHRRCQWVQIDLGRPCRIYAILLWHDHSAWIVCHDVIVQVSNDPEFRRQVKTLFNNDYDNSCGQGIGRDKEYFEDYQGKLIDAKGVIARYVRCYSNGYLTEESSSSWNPYLEIEVWGIPLKRSSP